MRKLYIPLLFLSLVFLSPIEAFASSVETVENIGSMLPALFLGGGIVFVAFLLGRIGLEGLAKVVGIIGLIIGGLALVGIVLSIVALIFSFVAVVLEFAFTAAFYVGLFLLACFIIYSIFNWLFTTKQ
ncbi:hypothetical protein [Pontibacter harenae]|uniref:hypothetical protein n=1 Tax=Pontibacter harenae TaxID=2894083 RepID=UPI001E3B926E|nr:hypothetical protein [Pontibacter harenae]MCC9168132.1 hypothetical protein [Pontibacter harenae]